VPCKDILIEPEGFPARILQVLFMQQAIKGIRQEFLPLPNEETPADGEPVACEKTNIDPGSGTAHQNCGCSITSLPWKC